MLVAQFHPAARLNPLSCVVIGALFSLPALLRPIVLDTAWPTIGTTAVMA